MKTQLAMCPTGPISTALITAFVGLSVLLSGCGKQQSVASAPAVARKTAAPAVPQKPGAAEMALAKKAYESGDRPRALEHFMAAGKEGDADAQYYAGVMWADGQGAKRNIEEAVKWYEMAAAQNQPDALFALARLYVLNIGVEANSEKAIDLFGRAAEAYPPGEKRERANEQRLSLLSVTGQPEASATPDSAAPSSDEEESVPTVQ